MYVVGCDQKSTLDQMQKNNAEKITLLEGNSIEYRGPIESEAKAFNTLLAHSLIPFFVSLIYLNDVTIRNVILQASRSINLQEENKPQLE